MEEVAGEGISSVWAPGSTEFSWYAVVGVVNLRGAPLAFPTFAAAGFSNFTSLGRAVCCLLPLGSRRSMHLAVLYGYQGAGSCVEQLQLTNQLFDAAFQVSWLWLLGVSLA